MDASNDTFRLDLSDLLAIVRRYRREGEGAFTAARRLLLIAARAEGAMTHAEIAKELGLVRCSITYYLTLRQKRPSGALVTSEDLNHIT